MEEEVSCQLIFVVSTSFLSADSRSIVLLSADLLFVNICLCRRHGNDAQAGLISFAPACFLTEKFSPSAGAHFRFDHNSIRFDGPSKGGIFKASAYQNGLKRLN